MCRNSGCLYSSSGLVVDARKSACAANSIRDSANENFVLLTAQLNDTRHTSTTISYCLCSSVPVTKPNANS